MGALNENTRMETYVLKSEVTCVSLTDNKTKKVLLQNLEQDSTPYSLNLFLPKLENYKPLKSKAFKI